MKDQKNKRNYKKSDNYKCVYFHSRAYIKKPKWCWKKNIDGITYQKWGYKTEREAALALDRKLIENGLQPINIFIAK